MTVDTATSPPVALPPASLAGDNAPTNGPASGYPFADLIALIVGSDEPVASAKIWQEGFDTAVAERSAAQSPVEGTKRVEQKTKAVHGGRDSPVDVAAPTEKTDDPMTAAITVPVWLWVVPEQPQRMAAGFPAQPDSTPRGDRARPPVDAANAAVPGDLGAHSSSMPSKPAGAGRAEEQTTPRDQATDPAIQVDVSNPRIRRSMTATARDETTDSRAAAAGRQSGHAPLRLATQPPDEVTAPSTSPGSERTDSAAASGQEADAARPADRAVLDHGVRTGDLPGKAADSKFAPSLAPLASMSSSAQTSTGQEKSAQSFAGHQGPRGDIQTPSADLPGKAADSKFAPSLAPLASMSSSAQTSTGQEKSAQSFAGYQGPRGDIQTPSAPAADGAVATTAFRAEHGASLAIGQAVEIVNVSSAGTTAVGLMLPDGNGDPAIPDDGDLRRQIVQGVRLQWRDGAGDARLTLRPEYLGEVTIALRVEQGSVTAHLSADAAEVRSWMGANESLLRQALADRGLELARLTVSDEPAKSRPDTDRRQRQPQQETEQRPRPQRGTGTFEIIV